MKYFSFHPALAAGPTLDALTVRAVATDHRQTEGTTIARLDGQLRVLASDKRRRSYPVLDLDLRDVGTLDAAYPSNIPWPTLVDLEGQSLLIGFNGSAYGGRLVGYGSHGEVVIQRRSAPDQSVTFSSGRTALRAAWIRDFTVPSGTLSRAAISL